MKVCDLKLLLNKLDPNAKVLIGYRDNEEGYVTTYANAVYVNPQGTIVINDQEYIQEFVNV